jgi:predicted nucleic acid-binding protein
MHYWDTSALAKLYVAESDSPQLSAHWAQSGVITTSALARWEIFCVLARKESDGLIPSGAAEIIFNELLADVAGGAVVLIPMHEAEEFRFRNLVLRLYRSKPPLFTRTLDGIHVATADLHGATEFVSTDLNMRKCAAAIGLAVYP